MLHFKKIVFICMDNTCSSIMAEAIMNGVQKELTDWEPCTVSSRGLVVLFPEPLNPKAIVVLQNNKLEVSKSVSEPLMEEDIGGEALLLAMTNREKQMAKERFPKALNLYTLCEFAGEQGEIFVPMGGSLEEYTALYEHLDLIVKMVMRRLMNF